MKLTEFAWKFAASLAGSIVVVAGIGFVASLPYGGSGSADKPPPAAAAKTAETAPAKSEPAPKAESKPAESAQPAKAPEKPTQVAQAPKAKKKKMSPKRLYLRRTCQACHGRNGAKAIQEYPNLAGQDKTYLIRQVKDIISGKRVGSPDATGKPRTEGMRGALVAPDGTVRITDEEIEILAEWLSAMPLAQAPAPETPPSAERIAQGKKLYAKCRGCHGKDGRKPQRGYPKLAGQKAAYLLAQMKDIRDKVRKNGKVKTMYPFVKKLTDDEMAAIADYLSQVPVGQ